VPGVEAPAQYVKETIRIILSAIVETDIAIYHTGI
jgi:hypothetical protein